MPKDAGEAAKWFRRAAEQGNIYLQLVFGQRLAKGDGVPKNVVEAHAWLNVAGARGLAEAKNDLVKIEQSMTREQIAEATKLSRELFEKYGPKE